MDIIRLIRPLQWVKNLFVFIPMFFAGQIENPVLWKHGIIAFIAMSFIASSIYCINDIIDAEENRRHPHKRMRPVAKGSVTPAQAGLMSGIMTLTGFSFLLVMMSGMEGLRVATILLAYYFLNIAYCLYLKQMAIIDVFCIGIGFVLRVFTGGVSCDIWVSPWLVCLTFLLTIFLAFAKRRDDIILEEKTGTMARKSSSTYNLPFMNMTLGLLGAITMVCYIIYTVQPEVEERMGTEWIYLTSIFVLSGILRYLQIAIVEQLAGDPTKVLLKDRFIQGCIVAWIISYLVIIYL